MAKRKKTWIQKAIKHPGAFTAEAQKHGMSAREFANYVLNNKDKFSTTTIRRAVLAKTLTRFSKNK